MKNLILSLLFLTLIIPVTSYCSEKSTQQEPQGWYLDLGLGNTSFAGVLSENIEGDIGVYIPVINKTNLLGLYFNQVSATDESSHYSQQSGGVAIYHFGGESVGEGLVLHGGVGYGSLNEAPADLAPSTQNGGVVGFGGIGFGAPVGAKNHLMTELQFGVTAPRSGGDRSGYSAVLVRFLL
jgi:hypothetical protein